MATIAKSPPPKPNVETAKPAAPKQATADKPATKPEQQATAQKAGAKPETPSSQASAAQLGRLDGFDARASLARPPVSSGGSSFMPAPSTSSSLAAGLRDQALQQVSSALDSRMGAIQDRMAQHVSSLEQRLGGLPAGGPNYQRGGAAGGIADRTGHSAFGFAGDNDLQALQQLGNGGSLAAVQGPSLLDVPSGGATSDRVSDFLSQISGGGGGVFEPTSPSSITGIPDASVAEPDQSDRRGGRRDHDRGHFGWWNFGHRSSGGGGAAGGVADRGRGGFEM